MTNYKTALLREFYLVKIFFKIVPDELILKILEYLEKKYKDRFINNYNKTFIKKIKQQEKVKNYPVSKNNKSFKKINCNYSDINKEEEYFNSFKKKDKKLKEYINTNMTNSYLKKNKKKKTIVRNFSRVIKNTYLNNSINMNFLCYCNDSGIAFYNFNDIEKIPCGILFQMYHYPICGRNQVCSYCCFCEDCDYIFSDKYNHHILPSR